MTWGDQLDALGCVALAMLLGGVIGIDRQIAQKPAGLRTLMLVSGAAALIVAVGEALVAHYARETWIAAAPQVETIRSDPIRLIEAIVTGVSFLGAGTIIRERGPGRVEGLTTAAAILFVAAVGMCVGLHLWGVAFGATLLALAVLRLFKPVEEKLF